MKDFSGLETDKTSVMKKLFEDLAWRPKRSYDSFHSYCSFDGVRPRTISETSEEAFENKADEVYSDKGALIGGIYLGITLIPYMIHPILENGTLSSEETINSHLLCMRR